jgi:hypothetical protein
VTHLHLCVLSWAGIVVTVEATIEAATRVWEGWETGIWDGPIVEQAACHKSQSLEGLFFPKEACAGTRAKTTHYAKKKKKKKKKKGPSSVHGTCYQDSKSLRHCHFRKVNAGWLAYAQQ